MYKLLIVDDEYNIREGLVNGIPWSEINVEVIGSAVDGDDAYEKVEQLSPDIVITDVSMDNMNGLDLAELLKQKYPLIKVIILSGYDDFEFVSRALELKVFTYIVKPVHSDELINTIRKTISEIEEEKKLKAKIHFMEQEILQNKSLMAERFLFDLINRNIENSHELELRSSFLDISFEKAYYTCLVIQLQDYYETIRNSGIKVLQSQIFVVRSILCDEFKEFELWPLIGGRENFVLLMGSTSKQDFSDFFTNKLEKIVHNITSLLNISISISIGGMYGNIFEISKSYKEALLASEYNSMSAKASIVSINDLKNTNEHSYIYTDEKENLIISILNDSTEDSLNTYINDLFNKIENQGYSKNYIRIAIMGLLSAVARKSMEMGVDIYQIYTHELIDPYSVMERYSTIDQIQNWLKNIITNIKIEIRNKQTKSSNSVIDKANIYIKENFRNPLLSLVDVSGHVFLNASYFSRLYKNETGESFVEALTRIRLDEAKDLLKDSDVKISTISEKIGYPSTRYFCSVFKKHIGITPLEYRKSM